MNSPLQPLSRRQVLGILGAPLAAPLFAACGTDRLLSPLSFAETAAGSVTLIGAGDPHAVRANYAHEIGRTINTMLGSQPNSWAFALGDLVNNGTAQEYGDYYQPAWGGFKDRTLFVIGNHDRKADPFGRAYYDYVGELGGERGKGYYAKTLAAWRCYFLNSEVLHSEQAAWLAADLRKWSDHHIMAMWHTPLFASPCVHSGTPMVWPGKLGPWWQLLQDHGAEFVVSGHVHRWERFRRMLRDGRASDRGVRQFIAGIGGVKPMNPLSRHQHCQRQVVTRGVARFELKPDRYKWTFTDVSGVVRDSGVQMCRKA